MPTPAGEGGHRASATFTRPWALPLVVGLGALLGAILVFRFAPEAEGHGTDAAISAVHHNPRGIRFRAVVVKIVASALTIGSGGSGGREGPTGQISAGFASLLARELDLSPADARIAVVTGIGSGIGAIFGAPLGGAVLATEILYRDDFDAEALLPSFVASLVGYVIFGAVVGFTPLFGFAGSYHFTDPAHLLWFALIGVLGGLIGLLYAKSFYGIADLFDRMPLPRWVKPAIGGVIVGLIALAIPEVLGHRLRMDPTGPRPPTPDPAAVDRPDPPLRPDPGHRALHRLGRFGRHLRSGHGHRRVHRRLGLAAVRAGRPVHGPQSGALRDRRDDVLLRGHLPGAAGGDVDGGGDDRQPLDPRSGHDRRRAGVVHRPPQRRHHLPQPARSPGRRPGPTAPDRHAGLGAVPVRQAMATPRLVITGGTSVATARRQLHGASSPARRSWTNKVGSKGRSPCESRRRPRWSPAEARRRRS